MPPTPSMSLMMWTRIGGNLTAPAMPATWHQPGPVPGTGHVRGQTPDMAGKSLVRGIIPRTSGVARTRDRRADSPDVQREGGEVKPAAPGRSEDSDRAAAAIIKRSRCSADARPVLRASGLLRAFLVVVAGIVAGVSLYVGFIQAGVIRNPFGPVLQGDLAGAKSDRPGIRLLFVGNSTTYYNGMPQMVQKLAEGDPKGRPVFVVSYTAPGWSLWRAARDERLADLIQDVPWNTVVLQEHGVLATASLERRSRMTNPYVRDLQRRIEARGARTMIFMNWWQREDSDLAAVLFLPVIPVGWAVVEAHRRRPDLQLFLKDGHPSRA